MTQPREKTVAELKQIGLIAVVRARSAGQVLPLAEALISGGMKAIEITFTTPDAPKAIRKFTLILAKVPWWELEPF